MAVDAMTGFHDQLMAECRDMIRKEMTASFGKMLERAPSVNVAAPHVIAQVTAASLDLAPVVEVNVDMAPVAAELAKQVAANAETVALLRQVIALLNAPVTKTVERGAGNWITRVVETR